MKIKIYAGTLALMLMSTLSKADPTTSTVGWASDSAAEFYTSTGSNFPTAAAGGYSFVLGTFADSGGAAWTPTATNTASWLANWKPLDTASYGSPTESDGSGDYFTGSFNVEHSTSTYSFTDASISSGGSIFNASTNLFIWIYNTTNIGTGTEWALLNSSTWKLPGIDTSGNGITPGWDLAGATAILGGVYGQATPAVGGDFEVVNAATYPAVLGGFQTAGIQPPQNVPEPSGAVLIGAAGLLAILRRRRF